MLLTVDIGNTNITVGVFEDDKILFVTRLATDRSKMPDQYAVELINIFRMYNAEPFSFSGAVIASVVPELTSVIAQAANRITHKAPLILSTATDTGLEIKTDNPSEVGGDLIAACVAAKQMYPMPCIIIDLGTASKLMVLDERGTFIGCTISPGVAISLEALSARTSQLPNISFCSPGKAIGRNTIDSMRSGIVFGTAAMLDGLCERISSELNCPVKTIVSTGGYSEDIVKNCTHKVAQNNELILQGLKYIYERNARH